MVDSVPITPGAGADIAALNRGDLYSQLVLTGNYVEPLAYGTADDLSSAIVLPSLPMGAVTAFVQVEGGDVRYRPDGESTPPTSSDGMLLPANTVTELPFGTTALTATRLIAAAGDPKITVVYG